jgi:TatD DNase family protein
LELAIKFDVFVNVHSRQAGHYVIDIIKQVGNTKVILLAFDGKMKYVRLCIDMPWYFSIPGSVQRNHKTAELCKYVQDAQIVIESDASALGPRKNEQATPLDLLETIQLRNQTMEDLLEILQRNESRIFSFIT